jgi:hypothetical protein
MQEPPAQDNSNAIITKLRKYVAKEYNTNSQHRTSLTPTGHNPYQDHNDLRNSQQQQIHKTYHYPQQQYLKASHGSTELLYEEEYEDPEYYPQEQDTRVSLAATLVNKPLKDPCSNCYCPDLITRECPSLQCVECRQIFNSAYERKNHYFAEHRGKKRSLSAEPKTQTQEQPRRSRFSSQENMNKYRPTPFDDVLRAPRPNNTSKANNTTHDAKLTWSGSPTGTYTLQSSMATDQNRYDRAEDDQPQQNWLDAKASSYSLSAQPHIQPNTVSIPKQFLDTYKTEETIRRFKNFTDIVSHAIYASMADQQKQDNNNKAEEEEDEQSEGYQETE